MGSEKTIAEEQEAAWKKLWNMTDKEWDRAWRYLWARKERSTLEKITAPGALILGADSSKG